MAPFTRVSRILATSQRRWFSHIPGCDCPFKAPLQLLAHLIEQPPNKIYICLSAFFAGRSFHSKQHVNEPSWWGQVSGIPLPSNKGQTDHCCTRLLIQMKNLRERAINWTYLCSEVLSEQKRKYMLCGSRKSIDLQGAALSVSDTCQVLPCSSLACAFGCYQRNLALYQDLFYIICYHYIASNQVRYYCCFHLARYGIPTPSLWRHGSVLGSTFLMLSLNFSLLLTQSLSPHRCLETMLSPPMSSFG